MIHIIGIGNPQIGVETIGGGENFWVMSKVPLTETRGCVAYSLQVISNGMFSGIGVLCDCWEKHMR